MKIVDDWKFKIANVIAPFKPEDIANCDKTGLFFRTLPSKILKLKGENVLVGSTLKKD